MARTAHSDPAMMTEHHDEPRVVSEKVARLATLISSCRHLVAFTGAGVSTSAGIPDFRGPEGKWTREARGQAALHGVEAVKALPTPTHMALVELQRRGILKYLISQNCDGLHRRSGFPAAAISELHGNSNLEVCENCDARYFRDFRCDRLGKKFDHFTGRFCFCGGRLLNSTVDFGQGLEPKVLDEASLQSSQCDLHLALGSSLTVRPACDLPAMAGKKRRSHLVICNRQRTPLTDVADFQIFADTDEVMHLLMQRLSIAIPPFRLQRRILLSCTGDKAVVAKAVDVHDRSFEVCILRGVVWDGDHSSVSGVGQDMASLVASRFGGHQCPAANLDLRRITPVLYFVGHYGEPPFELPPVDLSGPFGVDMTLSFDPCTSTWDCVQQERVSLEELHRASIPVARAAAGESYGDIHREYCEQGVMKQYGKTREEAVQLVSQRAKESAMRAKMLISSSELQSSTSRPRA